MAHFIKEGTPFLIITNVTTIPSIVPEIAKMDRYFSEQVFDLYVPIRSFLDYAIKHKWVQETINIIIDHVYQNDAEVFINDNDPSFIFLIRTDDKKTLDI